MNHADVINSIAPLVPFEESGYISGDDYYSARSLYDQAKKEKARKYKLKIRDIDFSDMVWRTEQVRIGDYAYHARRALNADLEIPIIVGPMGGIMDGYHRVLGALLDGREFVWVMRLKVLPKPNIHPDPDKTETLK